MDETCKQGDSLSKLIATPAYSKSTGLSSDPTNIQDHEGATTYICYGSSGCDPWTIESIKRS